MSSYPTPAFSRPALAPGILATIVLVAGVVLIGGGGFIWILYTVSILSLIVCVFAVQAKLWWWLAGFVPVALLWNPVVVFGFSGIVWQLAQFAAAFLFIAGGLLIKVVNPEDRNPRARR